jgi:hypothetical protein
MVSASAAWASPPRLMGDWSNTESLVMMADYRGGVTGNSVKTGSKVAVAMKFLPLPIFMSLLRLLLSLALPLMTSLVAAQDAEDSSSTDSTAALSSPAVPIEEITIVGERTLLSMRLQIEREEENLYSMFNDLNSSDEYDIKCRTVRRRESHISDRICEPVFLTNLRTASNRNALTEMRQAWSDEGIDPVLLANGMDLLVPEYELREDADPEFEQLSEEMLRIALEYPEYFARLQRIGNLKTEYEQARQQKFNKD